MKKLSNDTIRVSYSMLKAFEGGNVKGAVAMLLGLPTYMSASMAAGDELHQEWADHIRRTSQLPEVFGDTKLTNPIVEEKREAKLLGGKITLVGVPDCLASPAVFEFKTGSKDTKAEDYANTRQVGIYGLLAAYSEVPVTHAHICHWNFTTQQASDALVWITEATIIDTTKWVVGTTKQLLDYVQQNKAIINEIRKSYDTPAVL